jgi:hypothetical protein
MQPCQSISGLPTLEASLMNGQLRRETKTGKKFDFFGEAF